MAVTYTIVKPKYQLERPNFEIQMRTPIPIIDNRSFTFGQIQGTHNLYDDLLNNLSDNTQTKSQPETQSDNSNLLSAIKNHLGEIYNNAKRLKTGYSDCSGFVNKVYKDMGIDLKGASSIYMYNKLTDHIDFNQVQPGDLVFLTPKQTHNVAGTRRRAGIDSSHVAIVVEKQGTRVKVAENTGYKGKSDYTWYELGGADKPSGNGVVNYSKGNKGKNKNELLGFGRIRV